MDIGRALTFVFQDQRWITKALIGIVMLVIPIIGWLILWGYLLRVTRLVALGHDSVLPEWDDFGGDLVRGLKWLVVNLSWNIPVILISACVTILTAASSARGEGSTAANLLSICGSCLQFVVSMVILYILPLPASRLAVTERLSDAFAFPQILGEVRRAGVDLLVVLVLTVVAGIVASLGLLVLCVGILATFLYALLFQYHLWGQVRRHLGGATLAGESSSLALTN